MAPQPMSLQSVALKAAGLGLPLYVVVSAGAAVVATGAVTCTNS